MAENFRARIEAFADLSRATSDINSFVNQTRRLNIQVNTQFDNASSAFQTLLRQMQSQGGNAGAQMGRQFAQSFQSSLNNIHLKNGGIGNISRMLQGAGFDKSSIAAVTQELDRMVLTISKIQTKQLNNGNIRMTISGVDDLNRSVQIVREFDKETGRVANTSKTFTQSFKQSMKEVQKSTQDATKEAEKLKKQFSETNAKTFGNQMTAWLRNNSRAISATMRDSTRTYGQAIQDLQTRLQTAISNKDVGALKQIREEFRLIQSEARATGNVGRTFGESFSRALTSVTQFAASYISLYRVFNAIRDGIKTIVELDDALVDLQKTSTATPKQLSSFYKEANEIAKQYGTTTKQIIQGAADWSRLGYNLQDAQTMSKLSSQFAAISPGMTVEESTQGLVSTMKAFKIEADDVLDGIMSKVNKVGNSFALSNNDIMTALENSSSAMSAANNTLDETIALITAGTEIVQDASKVGNGLRTISMRIRGMNEETEELDDNLVSIKGDVYELTGGKVSIMEDADWQNSPPIWRHIGAQLA